VKLEQIDRVDAEMLETGLRITTDVVGREHLVEREPGLRRPREILRRNLRRGVEPLLRVRANELTEEALADAAAVCPSGIEEVASEAYRLVECLTREVVVRAGPPGQPPHPIPDLADAPSQPPECSIVHRCRFCRRM
jgi:hypothetical protein